MHPLIYLLVLVITPLIVHWKVPRLVVGSFLSALISTIIISVSSLFLGTDPGLILGNAITVFVLALFASAIVGTFFNKKRHKEQYEGASKTKIEKAREAYIYMEVALILSGIAMILLAIFHENTPLYLSIEGIFQLIIVLLLRRRWRWAFQLLVGYVSIALLVILSKDFADLFLSPKIFSPQELAYSITGAFAAGWLCFKGARGYKTIIEVELDDIEKKA